jgi:hypothetical protein
METHKNLAIFEDDDVTIKLVTFEVEKYGWQVAAIARSMLEAKNIIPLLEQLRVVYALVDGNLTSGDYSGREGQAIARKIKELAPTVTTVGFSSDSNQIGVDIPLGKRNFSTGIGDILNGSQSSDS